MSRETIKWLNTNVLRGFTDKRGHAWHYDAAQQGEMSNHYPGAIPADDILSRLFDWKAEPRTVYVDTNEGLKIVPEKIAYVRSDNHAVLGMHSEKYSGHDYSKWMVDHLVSLVGAEAQFANAGLLSGGAVAWTQIEMPDNVNTPEGVTVRPFILATTSFDGSIASLFKPGWTDTVCDNTRAQFLSEDTPEYRVKHTRNSAFVLNDAATAIDTLHLIADQAIAEIAQLCKIDVSDGKWSEFVQAHVPLSDDASKRSISLAESKRQALTGLWNNDARVTPWRNTAWGVVQAVNTYQTHMSIVRGAERFERNMFNAIKGNIATSDRGALDTLSLVMGRELATV